MFIDPDPKRQKYGMSPSPFLPQLPPTQPPPARIALRRKPLLEKTPSQSNQQVFRDLEKPTVRLVRNSISSLSVDDLSDTEDDIQTAKTVRVQRLDRAQSRLYSTEKVPQASVATSGLPGFSAPTPDESVSGFHSEQTSTNEAKKLSIPPAITLLPVSSAYAVPNTAWHRRNGSSGSYSQTSTLQGSHGSFAASRKSDRLSQGTTLRGTPTPTEQEHRERLESEAQGPAQALHTLQETSPERPAIDTAQPQDVSPNVDRIVSGSLESPTEVPVAPAAPAVLASPPKIPHKSLGRQSSESPVPSPLFSTPVGLPPMTRAQSIQPSLADFGENLVRSTSPVFVLYEPNASHPRSRNHTLRRTASIESIESRLQHPTAIYPSAGNSLAATGSWASLLPTSSTDTLPPLHIPRRRQRQQPTSLSLGSGSAFRPVASMEEEEYDTLPYPRLNFSNHLSTIASESDRSNSQHLSNFSLGSGVLTGDDASSMPASGSWPRRRRGSAPATSVASYPESSFFEEDESPGDMTLGLFREQSAMPEPLFESRTLNVPSASKGKRYDGPLPPMPPIPRSRDSDEDFDTVSELGPSLRPSRSGKSLRQRSDSTPSGHSRQVSTISYVEGERGSTGSSIFPVWAKHFYGGTGALLSSSKISMGSHGTPRPHQRQVHARNASQWTERSMTSRLGTGYSELETSSPTSSRFLPSIFRPRTRLRAETDDAGRSRSSKGRRSKLSRPSADTASRPDSMAIFSDPLPDSRDGELMPPGHPTYGVLKDSPGATRPRIPRNYSKQRDWDSMQYPRPMTKDRLNEFEYQDPHLAPSKRLSFRLSVWQAPSFVESLDTLVRSRGNRQILLFALGFVCPLLWMLGAVLPLPKRPVSAIDLEKSMQGSEEDVAAAMMKHEAGDAQKRFREDRQWMKAKWWRTLNRIMSVVGALMIGAIVSLYLLLRPVSSYADFSQIALAVVASRR